MEQDSLRDLQACVHQLVQDFTTSHLQILSAHQQSVRELVAHQNEILFQAMEDAVVGNKDGDSADDLDSEWGTPAHSTSLRHEEHIDQVFDVDADMHHVDTSRTSQIETANLKRCQAEEQLSFDSRVWEETLPATPEAVDGQNRWESLRKAITPREHSSSLSTTQSGQPSNRSQKGNSQRVPLRASIRRTTVTNLQLRPEWQDSSWISDVSENIQISRSSFNEVSRHGDEVKSKGSCLQPFIMRPTDVSRLVFGFCCVVMLSYDIVMLPMMAFEMQDIDTSHEVSAFTASFWSADLLVNFFTGYQKEGVIEMRPWFVAKNYLTKWFAPDFLIVAVDWAILFFFIQQSSSPEVAITSVGGVSRTTRVVRVFRVLRLLRAMKFIRMLNVVDNLTTEFMSILLRLLGLVLAILLVNHYLACLWFAIGYFNTGAPTWVEAMELHDANLQERYIVSLHWSLTQFTPATNNVGPRNGLERLFAVGVVLFALITFSSFVSSITEAMSQIRSLNNTYNSEKAQIRTFLSDRRISLQLGTRIWSYFRKHYRDNSTSLHESEVKFFARLPKSMRQQLREEVFVPILKMHPLLRQYAQCELSSIIVLCDNAMSEICLQPEQELFIEGGEADGLYFTVSGGSKYTLEACRPQRTVQVGNNTWICELALWCIWRHSGRLVAEGTCELVKVDASEGAKILQYWCPNNAYFSFLKKYASLFLQHAIEMSVVDGQVISDLCGSDKFHARKLTQTAWSSTVLTPLFGLRSGSMNSLRSGSSIFGLDRLSSKSMDFA